MFIQQAPIEIVPQQPKSPTIRLHLPDLRSQVDLERAQEIIGQVAEREDSILRQQTLIVPRIRKPSQPSVEMDPLMAVYQGIGCRQPVYFPDTIPLTVFEQYFFLPVQANTIKDTVLETTFAETMPGHIPVAVQTMPSSGAFCPANVRPDAYPSAPAVLFLLSALTFFAWIKYNFRNNLLLSVRSFFSYHQSCRIQDERRESDRNAAQFTNLFCYIVTGIFLSLSLPAWGIEPLWGSYGLSVVVFSLIAALTLHINVMIWKIFGNIFLIQSITGAYAYNMFLFNRNTGIFIFPLVIFLPFVSKDLFIALVYTIMAVIAVIYLLRVLRFFQIIRAKKVSAFYFILYLCTLEILPFLILLKTCKSLIDYN
jgi:hypothetical protein